MKLRELALCIACDSTMHIAVVQCPSCGSRAVVPLTRWIRPLNDPHASCRWCQRPISFAGEQWLHTESSNPLCALDGRHYAWPYGDVPPDAVTVMAATQEEEQDEPTDDGGRGAVGAGVSTRPE